jgi:hypothetical protein
MLTEGTIFAAYEVRGRIAAGGMGEVYLCRHRVLDRMDAVKVLLPHLAGNTAFRRRFLREALSAARLRHPNVVTVYTADEADGLLYLAMEYVPGEDMATVLDREDRLDPVRAVRLLAPVADALDAAHRANLVHRDLKPRNLMLSALPGHPERLTLVDFGISRLLDDDADITRTGEIVGTIAYCAPEQMTRGARVTGASDQYSLACVAYECLTGEVPFPREGQLAIMTAHLTAPPPRASAVRPDLPAAVDAVLARAMAKDPAARYATCAHFVAALANAVQAGRPSPATPTPPPAAPDEAGAPAGLLHAVRSATPPRRRDDPEFLRLVAGADAGGRVHVGLGAGPVAVRGDAEAASGVLRWLVAQVVARHDARDVCLVCALAPVPGETWLWLNWLPHARPATPPVTGPHIATTAEAAADLGQRLRAVVSARGDDPAQRWPAVVAVLDERLGITPVPWPQAAHAGVHLVYALRPQTPDPDGVVTLDLASPAWSPTSVDQAYVRDLSDDLPD